MLAPHSSRSNQKQSRSSAAGSRDCWLGLRGMHAAPKKQVPALMAAQIRRQRSAPGSREGTPKATTYVCRRGEVEGRKDRDTAEIRPGYGRGGAEGRWSRIRPRWREVESGLRDDGARQADEGLDKRDDATALAPEVEHGRREGGRGDELSADVHYAGAQHERGARVDRSGRRGSGGDRIHGNLQRCLDGAAEQQAGCGAKGLGHAPRERRAHKAERVRHGVDVCQRGV